MLPEVHQKHNLASPSPVTDGKHVYAWFGTGQLVALDVDGKLAWKRHLGKDYGPFDINWGHGSSPTLYRDLVILLCDHDPASYLVALDKRTGAVRWKTEREKGSVSYSTPTVVAVGDRRRADRQLDAARRRLRPGDGQAPLVGRGRHPLRGPRPRLRGRRAVHEPRLPQRAVHGGARGRTRRRLEDAGRPGRSQTGAPYVSSLLHYQGLVYMANDVGVVTAVDAKTGEKVWQERIEGIFTASPGGRGRQGLPASARAARRSSSRRDGRRSVLARNSVGERSVATPAISDGQIFIRTDDNIICVGKKS